MDGHLRLDGWMDTLDRCWTEHCCIVGRMHSVHEKLNGSWLDQWMYG